MGQRFGEVIDTAMTASDKGKFLKLPRYQKNLKYNFDGLYSYNTRAALLDLPRQTITKLGRWSPTSTAHYNYARRFLEDTYGFRELMSH